MAVGVAALAVPALFSFARVGYSFPRFVYVLSPLLLVVAMGASRLASRAWRDGRLMPMATKAAATPVIVLGAGTMSAGLLRDLAASPQWRAVGLLDDDPRKLGAAIQGVKVLGTVDRVADVARSLGVTKAIIAMPDATHRERKRAVDLCTAAALSVMTVPALTDIVSGKVSLSPLRPIQLDHLLGPHPVELDDVGMHAFLERKTILVTGAGGSIGSDLCPQSARFSAPRILLLHV